MIIKNVLVVFQEITKPYQAEALDKFKRIAQSKGINCKFRVRTKLRPRHFNGYDMVMTLGGDGTFLKASHFVLDNTPMMGINTNPKRKEGFFTATDCVSLPKLIDDLRSEKKQTIRLMRLDALINGKRIYEPALNEVYVGREHGYCTAKYIIKVGNKEELQRSSGIIASTPAGSTAWALSAGGKVMPINSRKFQLVVREPYHGKLSKRSITQKILGENDIIQLQAVMGNKIVVMDSLSPEYKLKLGDVLTIKISKHDLNFVR